MKLFPWYIIPRGRCRKKTLGQVFYHLKMTKLCIVIHETLCPTYCTSLTMACWFQAQALESTLGWNPTSTSQLWTYSSFLRLSALSCKARIIIIPHGVEGALNEISEVLRTVFGPRLSAPLMLSIINTTSRCWELMFPLTLKAHCQCETGTWSIPEIL